MNIEIRVQRKGESASKVVPIYVWTAIPRVVEVPRVGDKVDLGLDEPDLTVWEVTWVVREGSVWAEVKVA